LDLVDQIRVVFKVDSAALRDGLGRGVSSPAAEAERRLLAATRAARSLTSALGTLRNVAIAGGAAYALKSLVGVTAQAESSQIGIATLLQSADKASGVGTSFASAMNMAGETLAALRKEAVETPATFGKVAEAFQVVAMQARMAGMPLQDLTRLAGNMATLDQMLFGGSGVVARDVQQLMRGEAGDVATPVLAAEKLQLAALARRDQAAALAKMTKLLEVDPEARAASGRSFEGQLSTAKDRLSEIAQIAGRPLMARLNQSLGDMLGWLDQNRAKVEEIATKIGTGIAKAVEWVGKAIAWLVDNPLAAWALGITVVLDKVGLLGAAFKGVGLVLSGLATNPFFAAIAAAGGLIYGLVDFANQNKHDRGQRVSNMVNGGFYQALTGFNPNDASNVGWHDMEAKRKMALGFVLAASANAIAGTKNHVAVASTLGGGLRGLLQSTVPDMPIGRRTKAPVFNVDARNARVQVRQDITTNDPGQLAGATLAGAFRGLVQQTLTSSVLNPLVGR